MTAPTPPHISACSLQEKPPPAAPSFCGLGKTPCRRNRQSRVDPIRPRRIVRGRDHATTLPPSGSAPTPIGRPVKRVLSRSSTEAKKASMSMCPMIGAWRHDTPKRHAARAAGQFNKAFAQLHPFELFYLFLSSIIFNSLPTIILLAAPNSATFFFISSSSCFCF